MVDIVQKIYKDWQSGKTDNLKTNNSNIMNKTRIAPIHNAPLVVNEHGLHVQLNDGMLPIDGLTCDDVSAYAHIKHRSGMNDTLFANTRIHPFQEIINNTIIKYYEG